MRNLDIALVGLFGAIIGAVIAFFGAWYMENNRRKQEKQKEQKRAYSRLSGCEYLLLQTYKLHSVIHIDKNYWNCIDLMSVPDTVEYKMSYLANSPLIKRSDETRYKSYETVLEIGKSREKFEECLADIELLFSDSPKIRHLINQIRISIRNLHEYWRQIEKDDDAVLEQETPIKDKREKLLSRKSDQLARYPKKVNEVMKNIDALLNYLKTELEESNVQIYIKADEAGAYYEESGG